MNRSRPRKFNLLLLAVLLLAGLGAIPVNAVAQPGPPCILLGMLGVPCPPETPGQGPPTPSADDPLNSASPALASQSNISLIGNPQSTVPGASSTLIRTNNGASGSFTTSGVEPNAVYTLWWAVFNNPENCTETCTGADLANPDVQGGLFGGSGQVSDEFGRVHLEAHVFKGEDPGLDQPNPNAVHGLLDPLGAEIHLVIRSHGPAAELSAVELEMALSTFAGGCTINPCDNEQFAVHLPLP